MKHIKSVHDKSMVCSCDTFGSKFSTKYSLKAHAMAEIVPKISPKWTSKCSPMLCPLHCVPNIGEVRWYITSIHEPMKK